MSLDVPLTTEEFEALRELYAAAEDRLKEIELIDQDLIIASVNQLRYAGYHIVKALSGGQDTNPADELKAASRHCKRAVYDANEAGMLFYLGKIKDFREVFLTSSKVLEVLPNYKTQLAEAESAKEFIDKARKEKYDDRDSFYEQSEPHFLKIKEIAAELEVAAPQINDLEEEQELKNTREARHFILYILALLVAAVAIGAIGLVLYKSLSHPHVP